MLAVDILSLPVGSPSVMSFSGDLISEEAAAHVPVDLSNAIVAPLRIATSTFAPENRLEEAANKLPSMSKLAPALIGSPFAQNVDWTRLERGADSADPYSASLSDV